MKKISTILVFSIFLLSIPISAGKIQVGGTIGQDTTWTGTDTVLVTSIVTVPSYYQLTIEPGMIVMFDNNIRLSVMGRLSAIGTESEPVIFTSAADTAGGLPFAGIWTGISFQTAVAGSMDYCHIRYAREGIYAYLSSPELYQCTIENISNRGLYIDGFDASPMIKPVLECCTIRQSDPDLIGTGIAIFVFRSADITISNCRISGWSNGIELYGLSAIAPRFQVTDSEIKNMASMGIYAHTDG